jgi:Methylamine utilisation protein MauE
LELIGPYLIGCTLLLFAGAMKALHPDNTARALAQLMPARLGALADVRRMRGVMRLVALLEAGLGIVALAWPRPLLAALVAASYLVFAAFVAYARARGGALASCGCFGTPDTPATLLHVVVDLVVALAAVLVATSASSTATIGTVLSRQPLHGAPLLVVSAVGAWLTYLTLSMLGTLEAVRRTVNVFAKR